MKDVFVLREELSKKRDINYRSGFTLIELLLVIAIIAILAAIAITQYIQYMPSAASGAALADARQCLDEIIAQNTAAVALGTSSTIDSVISAACPSIVATGGSATCTCVVAKGIATGTGICSSNSTSFGCTAM